MQARNDAGTSWRDTARRGAVVVAAIATFVVNGLANAVPIGGRTTGVVSEAYPVLFTPAGYAFSIWGLIYLSLFVYAVTQALPSRRARADHRAVGWLFVGTCAFNIAWLLAWHHLLIPYSLLLMLGLLYLLVRIYLRLDTVRSRPRPADYWTLHFPFSLYLGWITVATVANVTIALYHLGWRGEPFGEELWAVVAIAAALAVGLMMMWKRGDTVFGLVLVWAFIAIAVGQSQHLPVATAATVAAALQLAGVWYALLALRRRGDDGSPS